MAARLSVASLLHTFLNTGVHTLTPASAGGKLSADAQVKIPSSGRGCCTTQVERHPELVSGSQMLKRVQHDV